MDGYGEIERNAIGKLVYGENRETTGNNKLSSFQ